MLIKLRKYYSMRFLKAGAFLLIFMLTSFTLHKYYISVTEIRFVEDKKEIQITMRFFIDDFEKVMNERFKKDFALATPKESSETEKYLFAYTDQKFKIKINDQLQKLNYLGKEYENDVVYIYLLIANIAKVDQIEIESKMLFEEFDDQENYVQLNINGERNTLILTRKNDKEMLKY